mgnify:CR=1 FL=1
MVSSAKNFKIRGSSGKLNIALDGLPTFNGLDKNSRLMIGDMHFHDSLARLDEHRTVRGTWLLPRTWLQEKQVAYWVAGGHMGLEHNRRSAAVLERESTLRVLRLLTRPGR